MNRIILLLAAVAMTGCYNDFSTPEPAKIYTAEDFAGSTILSVSQFKQLFYDVYGTGAAGVGQTLPITEDYVISGRIISSDRTGNVYKSLYIYDQAAASAIEIKLYAGNYVIYHPGQTIFIKTQGLAIGSYRYMLSIGTMPSASDVANGYANSNMEDPVTVSQHIFPGADGLLTAADTLVVNAANYQTLLTDQQTGRLVRFEGVTSRYGSYAVGTYSDRYPNYLEALYLGGASEPTYATKYYVDELIPGTELPMPDTWSYNYAGERYYGSSWFTYGNTMATTGNYIARVSGYARFALQPLPPDGASRTITAIYVKYCAKNKADQSIRYQLLLNSIEDVQ